MSSTLKLYDTERYEVVETENALNETGQAFGSRGYAIVNKDTGITERTSMCLPDAMFTADSFNKMLTQLLAEDTEQAGNDILEGIAEDVSIN